MEGSGMMPDRSEIDASVRLEVAQALLRDTIIVRIKMARQRQDALPSQ